MSEFIHETLRLYRDAGGATWRSLHRSWALAPAVLLMAGGLYGVTVVVVGLGNLFGDMAFALANAFVVGMFLALLEQAVLSERRMGWADLWDVKGRYVRDIITIGFLVWAPLRLIEIASRFHPYGPVIVSAIVLLLFILLNPIPELLYQGRAGASLETFRDSYQFVLEHWIEWFAPLAVVVAPWGVSFFFALTSGHDRFGLDFFQIMGMPFAILSQWLRFLGVPPDAAVVPLLLLTPFGTALMMLFRGHLYRALSGSSRRQRALLRQTGGR